MSRPEHIAPPEIFYNDAEAKKYHDGSRMQAIQAEMTLRAIDLLELPPDTPSFILDIGCGSGLSGEILEQEGHYWVGMDIAPSMLEVAISRESAGDLLLSDMGHGVPFRAGSFDGAISISVLQWLLNADKSNAYPQARLHRFFTTLYSALKRGAKAIFQFYPETDQAMEMITSAATKCGFGGGIIIDFPESKKAKKYYLCLQVGGGGSIDLNSAGAQVDPADLHKKTKQKKVEKSRKDWILKKKELYRKRGKMEVPLDSKYTARKRRPKF